MTGQDVFICPKESLQQAKVVLRGNSLALELHLSGPIPSNRGALWGSGLWILVFKSIKPSNNRERASLRLLLDLHQSETDLAI